MIHSITKGDPTKPTVVYLHGMLGASRNLYRLIESTAQAGFHVIAYDQVGHGHSSHPKSIEDYALKHLGKVLLEVLDQHSVKSAHLIGHSMGARVCLAAAAQAPARAKTLVMLDAGVLLTSKAESELTDIMGALEDSYATKQDAESKLSFLPEAVKQFLLSNLRTQPSGEQAWIFDLQGIRESFSMRLDTDQTEDWKKVQCPTLLVRGAQSGYLTRDTQEKMVTLNPHARAAEISNAGHWLHAENFTDTFKAILDFLNQNERKGNL